MFALVLAFEVLSFGDDVRFQQIVVQSYGDQDTQDVSNSPQHEILEALEVTEEDAEAGSCKAHGCVAGETRTWAHPIADPRKYSHEGELLHPAGHIRRVDSRQLQVRQCNYSHSDSFAENDG